MVTFTFTSTLYEGSWLTLPGHYFGLVRVVLETFPERRYFLLRFCLYLGTFSKPINTHNNGFSVQNISRSITDFFTLCCVVWLLSQLLEY